LPPCLNFFTGSPPFRLRNRRPISPFFDTNRLSITGLPPKAFFLKDSEIGSEHRFLPSSLVYSLDFPPSRYFTASFRTFFVVICVLRAPPLFVRRRRGPQFNVRGPHFSRHIFPRRPTNKCARRLSPRLSSVSHEIKCFDFSGIWPRSSNALSHFIFTFLRIRRHCFLPFFCFRDFFLARFGTPVPHSKRSYVSYFPLPRPLYCKLSDDKSILFFLGPSPSAWMGICLQVRSEFGFSPDGFSVAPFSRFWSVCNSSMPCVPTDFRRRGNLRRSFLFLPGFRLSKLPPVPGLLQVFFSRRRVPPFRGLVMPQTPTPLSYSAPRAPSTEVDYWSFTLFFHEPQLLPLNLESVIFSFELP